MPLEVVGKHHGERVGMRLPRGTRVLALCDHRQPLAGFGARLCQRQCGRLPPRPARSQTCAGGNAPPKDVRLAARGSDAHPQPRHQRVADCIALASRAGLRLRMNGSVSRRGAIGVPFFGAPLEHRNGARWGGAQ